MQIDNIRIDPWIPTVRLTTLMLMLACSGIGILIGRLTTEKIVVTQDRPPRPLTPLIPRPRPHRQKKVGGRAANQRTVRAELRTLGKRRPIRRRLRPRR